MADGQHEVSAERIRAMLDGLTSIERMMLDRGMKAEEAWRRGEGDPETIRKSAENADRFLRAAIGRRESRGEGEGDLYSTLAYLKRCMNMSPARFVTFNDFGCDRNAEEIVFLEEVRK